MDLIRNMTRSHEHHYGRQLLWNAAARAGALAWQDAAFSRHDLSRQIKARTCPRNPKFFLILKNTGSKNISLRLKAYNL
jgi:beta-galactosidase/beta-glucuronidase